MITRRRFLEAGGLALAGLAFAPRMRWLAHRGVLAASDDGEVVIGLRSDRTGARVWFEPAGVLVRPGQTVRWVLREGVHSTTAYHPANGGRAARIPAGAEPWDSGLLVEPGASFAVTPRVEGVYDYFCLPHEAAGMVGRLVVAKRGAPGIEPGAPPTRGPGGLAVPAAALAAFPDVAEILRAGAVGAR